MHMCAKFGSSQRCRSGDEAADEEIKKKLNRGKTYVHSTIAAANIKTAKTAGIVFKNSENQRMINLHAVCNMTIRFQELRLSITCYRDITRLPIQRQTRHSISPKIGKFYYVYLAIKIG